ncbi:NADPH-dependent 1-acyldihydroxyacetone phosphate reductase [Paramyrothecium foliicola]|nr:NADPH-dependent 1-acyldihydroxyacetone phosphate reductase [Paramyrothecium foliicola]
MQPQRTILITGCSDGGLGCALALALHRIGWRVIATARNVEKLKETTAAGIESAQLDITSQPSIEACVEVVSTLTHGKLDALLNNAGSGCCMPFMDLDLGQVRQVFEVNTFSLIPLTKAFLPLLRNGSGRSMVINNTSVASRFSFPFFSAYNASKAAAASLTESLRYELAPFNIKVVEIVTGAVESQFFQNAPPSDLAPASIYWPAKEAIEKIMRGEYGTGTMNREQWAKQVAADLSSSKPPYQIWRGKNAFEVRIVRLLPAGWIDWMVEPMTGLDVLRTNLNKLEKSK